MDVVVVGGGITGALVACAFASAKVAVAVVEADLVGRGSTAASSALLLQEPDQGIAQLAHRYGRAASTRIWQLSHEAVHDFVRTITDLDIACDLVARDAVHYATNADAERRLLAECTLRNRLGFETEWLRADALREVTGIEGRGAIRTSGNAQFNPYTACLGLLRAAVSSGAQVFERSGVTRIDRIRDAVRIRTPMGRIDAARVVIATGYATSRFRPLAGRFRMYNTYVLATPPLSRDERRELGLGNVMVWDTERPYHYARWTADHRLLLGGADRPVRSGQRRDQRFTMATHELREDFETLFPT